MDRTTQPDPPRGPEHTSPIEVALAAAYEAEGLRSGLRIAGSSLAESAADGLARGTAWTARQGLATSMWLSARGVEGAEWVAEQAVHGYEEFVVHLESLESRTPYRQVRGRLAPQVRDGSERAPSGRGAMYGARSDDERTFKDHLEELADGAGPGTRRGRARTRIPAAHSDSRSDTSDRRTERELRGAVGRRPQQRRRSPEPIDPAAVARKVTEAFEALTEGAGPGTTRSRARRAPTPPSSSDSGDTSSSVAFNTDSSLARRRASRRQTPDDVDFKAIANEAWDAVTYAGEAGLDAAIAGAVFVRDDAVPAVVDGTNLDVGSSKNSTRSAQVVDRPSCKPLHSASISALASGRVREGQCG